MEFLLGDARSVALPAGGFDLILAHFVLHDVDRAALPATVAALARSLRPGGRFVVVEPDTSAGPWRRVVPSHHHLPADELRATMAAAGLVEQSREAVRPLLGSAARTVFLKAGPSATGDR